jgi:hypothetical protein
MTLAISLVAILISIASFAFNLHQYKHSKTLKYLEKSNEILRGFHRLRNLSQDLSNKINSTDDLDVGTVEHSLAMFNEFVEIQLPKIMENDNATISELYKLERKLSEFELGLELFSKQIDVSIDFHKQVDALKK